MFLRIPVLELSPILTKSVHSLETKDARAALGIERTARRFTALQPFCVGAKVHTTGCARVCKS